MNEEELKKQIQEKLKEVNDPEIGFNIVDLGLVYNIDIDLDKKKIDIKLGLTTPFCPLAPQILGDAYEAVASIDFITKNKFDVNIEFDFETPWSPERMNPELRDKMGL